MGALEIQVGEKKVLPQCVSGATDEDAIAEAFSGYFAEACTPNDKVRSEALHNDFLKHSSNCVIHDNLLDYLISEDTVTKSIEGLKTGKSPGADSIAGEHIKNAHPILRSILTKLFNCIILTEYVPDAFGVSTLVPIPKAGKSHIVVDGYRGISLTPVISKNFERCLLQKFLPYLKTSDRQFGFKPGTGCTSAVYSVRKTRDYFVKRKSTVIMCSLDMEKAFDKMNRDALFIKMIQRGVPLTLIKILDGWFEKSCSSVRWGGGSSDFFPIRSGTRQGGVFSPILFSVFIDDVLSKLEELNCGCFIKNMCLNSFMYADDLILLSISVRDMLNMLEVCKEELSWLDMRLNISKSSAIRIGERWDTPFPPSWWVKKASRGQKRLNTWVSLWSRAKFFQFVYTAQKYIFFRVLMLF